MIVTQSASVKCACGWSGTRIFDGADEWRAICPECNHYLHHPDPPTPADEVREAVRAAQERAKLREDGTLRFGGNRKFAGSEAMSVTEAYHPNEVKVARQHMSQDGFKILDSGRVMFDDRRGERKHAKELRGLKQRMGVPED